MFKIPLTIIFAILVSDVIIAFSLIYGINGESNYKEALDAQNAKMEEIRNALTEKAENYDISIDGEIKDSIHVSVSKTDEQAGTSLSLLITLYKKDSQFVIDHIMYSNEFRETTPGIDYVTVHHKRPSKEEVLNIVINNITECNNILQSLNIDSELTKLYLPSDEFKHAFLSTENWEDLKESSTSRIGYPAQDSNDGVAQYTVENSNLGSETISNVVLFVSK